MGKLTNYIAKMASKAHSASGERDFLLRQMPENGTCAEIGVYTGDFSRRILAKTKPKSLYLIDPWKFERNPKYEMSVYGKKIAGSQQEMDRMYENVKSMFSNEIENKQVIICRKTSSEAAKEFRTGFFDWIYIDGDHTYEFVKSDLEMYSKLLKPHGILAGDEYDVPGKWWEDGVTRAVDEFAEKHGYKVTAKNHQFLIKL